MIARCFRAVERSFALAAVETSEMSASERRPNDAFRVDVGATYAEARQRHIIDLRERSLRGIWTRRNAHDRARKTPERAPYGAVGRARHHGIETCRDPLVLRWIHRLV